VELDHLRAEGDYTFVGGPFGSDLTQRDYVPNPGVPVIRGTNLGGSESRFIDDGFVFVSESKAQSLRRNTALPGDVVFTQRGTLGQVAVIPKMARFDRYVISQSQMKMTPDLSKLDSRYLYHYFRTPRTLDRLLAQTQATGVPHINLGILKRFPVVLPPLPDQRRIATILDKADDLRAKRRAALVQLDGLAQSVFVEMFGDPAANPNSLPREELKSLCSSPDDIKCGPFGTQLARSEFTDAGVPLWGIKHVNARFTSTTSEYLAVRTARRLIQYSIEPGDIVMTRKGTVGHCAIYPEALPLGIMHSDLLRLRVSREKCDPVFLAQQLRHSRDVAQQVGVISGGAVMPGINVTKLKRVKVLVPPLHKQSQYARAVVAVESLKAVQRDAVAQLDVLFASLQHRAFVGEL
jgi:type I restriction enzyme S subunit